MKKKQYQSPLTIALHMEPIGSIMKTSIQLGGLDEPGKSAPARHTTPVF